jgi:hypothetical protein
VFALILHHLLPPLSGDFESFVACGLLNRNDEVGRKTLYQCMLANRGMLIEARRILWRNLQLNISGSSTYY